MVYSTKLDNVPGNEVKKACFIGPVGAKGQSGFVGFDSYEPTVASISTDLET